MTTRAEVARLARERELVLARARVAAHASEAVREHAAGEKLVGDHPDGGTLVDVGGTPPVWRQSLTTDAKVRAPETISGVLVLEVDPFQATVPAAAPAIRLAGHRERVLARHG